MKKTYIPFLFLLFLQLPLLTAQHSVARQWNEVLLNAIRSDFARPTVHARNLFHSSLLLYDSWALLDDTAETVFLGKTFQNYSFAFEGIPVPTDIEASRTELMSYAMFRLLLHRFDDSPGRTEVITEASTLMATLGYDTLFEDVDYSTGSFAALGNYMANEMIVFGLQDGANEANAYDNQFYTPVNEPLVLETTLEVYDLEDPNRWQPLAFDVFVDQSGNEFPGDIPEFLSPEWGQVAPFALKASNLQILNNGFDSYIYSDPGTPPMIQALDTDGFEDPYKWNFALVASWSSHLDPDDATLIDISPGAIGNVSPEDYPSTFADYQTFYDFENGGDIGLGHDLNPFTNQPYEVQLVKRSDYARVLAEFWADGPDSETPPGHWFTILNYVSDHPETIKQIEGEGTVVSDLEWDVKAYLAMGGAMHDAAVTTWGIKGYYDYIRPISAIRYMARGQSTDTELPSYDPHGLPLVPGLIELIAAGDPLAGTADENVGRIKIFAWRGPDFIDDPEVDAAGVGWILATEWWPYQRPSFVTPPFAGYVSGHSTFSSAAAEVLAQFTGDAFFPGGMGVFDVVQNEFLVFEQGPTESFALQWATYRDASDQTSLSRIWGGIHPPVDDIPGRKIGLDIGLDAFALAKEYFNGAAFVPSDNFTVKVQGESCFGQNNGSISIEAQDYYDYSANISGENHPFTNALEVNELQPGNYLVCITIEGNGEFERCFEVVVPAVESIAVSSGKNTAQSLVTLTVEVGTPPFTVTIDNEVVGTFEERSFEVPNTGSVLQVSTALPCEGTYALELDDDQLVNLSFPNPVGNSATIVSPTIDGWIGAVLYDSSGKAVLEKSYYCEGNRFDMDLSGLTTGIYYLVLDNKEKTTYAIAKE